MALVLNALDQENSVTAGGNTFTFKPKQVKHFFNEDIAKFICSYKAEQGFMAVPSEFDDAERPELRVGPAYEAVIAELAKKGVENYCAFLSRLIQNEKISLMKDLRRNNDPSDPRYHMSPGMVKNLEDLAKYRAKKDDAEQRKVDRIKELEKSLEEGKE